MNRNINQPKINAPNTMMRKRERAYLIWDFFSFLLISAKTIQTKAE